MHGLIVPAVEQPERFFPAAVVLRKPQLRELDDGYGELWMERTETWKRIHPVYFRSLEGIAQGLPWNEVVARAAKITGWPESGVDSVARRTLWTLHGWGYVEIPLEEPPAVFHGRYARLKKLGSGGFGVVHLCEDLQDGRRRVAVKHGWGVKHDIADSQRSIVREMEILRSLDHPGVPRLRDTFEIRGLVHIVRDAVDGRPLDRAAREPGADAVLRIDMLRQVAEVLDHLHRRGFVLVDISPGNFLRGTDGKVVVIDVGSARPLDDGRATVHGAPGTPGYVPSEFLDRMPGERAYASPASDVFSLGRIAYALLAGRRPRKSWRHPALMEAVAELRVEDPERRFIDLCSRDAPADRPQDMQAAAALLDAL